MPKYEVMLGRLIREVKTVVVEAESPDALEDMLNEIYAETDDCDGWEPDFEWGTEEAECHVVLGEVEED